MPHEYTITITNSSGASQEYALFQDVPKFFNQANPQISPNVFSCIQIPAGDELTLTLTDEYYGIVGSSRFIRGQSKAGVTVKGSEKVTLGKGRSDGTLNPGTTLFMDVQDDAPLFTQTDLPNKGCVGGFQIRTTFQKGDNTSNLEYAKKWHWAIGVGARSLTDGSTIVPRASFVPAPGLTYEMEPVTAYSILVGKFQPGSIVDDGIRNQVQVRVDFAKEDIDVALVHTEQNELVIQRRE